MDARTAVLREIARSGSISRADLARKLSISGPTVTEVTRQLVIQGLVEELEPAPSTGGRPPIRLGLVKGAATAVGLKLMEDRLVGVVVDLEGAVIDRFEKTFSLRGDDVAPGLAAAIRSWVDDSDHATLGVGIGMPGVVANTDHPRVFSPLLGLAGEDFSSVLETELGVPVLIDNDVNTLAAAEVLYGLGREFRNFFTVTVGRGIGLGIVINGEVFRGTHGAAEFGHIKVADDGPVCDCGNQGCLESIISTPALLRRAKAAGILAANAGVTEMAKAAESGDARLLALFSEAASMLGTAVGNLTNILAPEAILISGEGASDWAYWQSGFEESLRRVVYQPFSSVQVLLDLWDDTKWAQGAAAQVLRAGFAPSLNDSSVDRQVRSRLASLSMDEAS